MRAGLPLPWKIRLHVRRVQRKCRMAQVHRQLMSEMVTLPPEDEVRLPAMERGSLIRKAEVC